MTIPNPCYPLKFERFGSANPDRDPELKKHIEELYLVGSPVSCEQAAMPNVYASKSIYKAEEKARKCYSYPDSRTAVKEAREALKISPHCPEAYNVLALRGAETYKEALDFYNKAVEAAPTICSEFDSEVAEGKCWEKNHLRSYLRAVHGQANTLRKMGRCKEALKKYLILEKLDKGFHSFNWRYHVLEVYMKIGDDKGALAFASKKSNEQAFSLPSCAGAWLWSLALLDYRHKQRRGFATEYFSNAKKKDDSPLPVGAIIHASQACRYVVSFLTGERKLPDCKIPYEMKAENSLSNAAAYCMSNLELWKSTPGAIDWAVRNAHTNYCIFLMRKQTESLKYLRIEPTLKSFKNFVKKGVFLDANLPGCEGGLVGEAVKYNAPDELEVLLKAGGKPLTYLSRGMPQPLHVACYYNRDPKIIELLCKFGADPTCKCGLHYCPIEMAAEQGAAVALKTAIKCFPERPAKVKNEVMNDVFFVLQCTSCYECVVSNGARCQRCSHDSPHPEDISFTGCVDVLMEAGYVPTKKFLIRLHQMRTFKPDLFQYMLQGAIKQSPSLKCLEGITDSGAWKNICSYCEKEDVKTMMCAGCRSIRYCSKECQKADWKNHRRVCY